MWVPWAHRRGTLMRPGVLSPNELLFHGGIGVGGKVLSDAWILRLLEKNENNVSISWVKVVGQRDKKAAVPKPLLPFLGGGWRRVFITGGTCQSEDVEDVWHYGN
ncbi:hypothetical protein TcBrA4_0023140 [Trypanosoma cruzi]|nr:hypothetical protein TcBrA4_0023140 [Trypanosoma cruzi]